MSDRGPGASALLVLPVTGMGEVRPGDDLAALVVDGSVLLADGDVLVVTSKVVSKAEGRVVRGDRSAAVVAETDRVVARRGDTAIVRNRLGLVMAAAGVDASNTEPGTVVLLPENPDRSARHLRERMQALRGVNVAVVVTDTSGRAWREGQTDLAVGAAGIEVLEDHAGEVDGYGNTLAVTAPAVADEVAAAGDLVKGKLRGCPVAVIRGLDARVLPPGRHGPGAAALVRPEHTDMFGYGAREAVLAALTGGDERRRGFGDPAPASSVAGAVRQVVGGSEVTDVPGGLRVVVPTGSERETGAVLERLRALALAHAWRAEPEDGPAGTAVVTVRPLSATP